MNSFEQALARWEVQPAPRPTRRSLAALVSDLLPLGDFLCLVLAASVSAFALPPGLRGDAAPAAGLAAVLAPFILYDKRFGLVARRWAVRALVRSHVIRFTLLVAMLLGLGALSDTLGSLPSRWGVSFAVLALASTSLTRVLAALHLHGLQGRGVLTEAVAIVGAGPLADRLAASLRDSRTEQVDLLGVFDDADLEPLVALAQQRRIDWIVLANPPAAATLASLKGLSASIGVCPPHLGSTPSHRDIDYVADTVPMLLVCDRPIKRWDAVVKAGEDLLLGSLLTLLLLPLLALIGLAVKLSGPGPVIFTQRRHAFNNREFDIYKFRTMRWDPPVQDQALQQTARHDGRVTRVGRFLRASSLDELPQLFNVLQGHMSLVGPRPHATDMRTESRLGGEITETYTHRHRVKPGITGWAQVNGARGATDTEAQLRRRIELDLHYIENWSLMLDLKILVLTWAVVVSGTDAY